MKHNQLAVALITMCSGIYAQSFDVASIKHCPNEHPLFRFDRLSGGHEVRGTTTLGILIRMTCHTTSDYVVKPAGSSWIDQDWWDLDAKSDQPLTESGMTVMLQNLLADLCLDRRSGGLKLTENNDAPQSELTLDATRDSKFVLRATAVTMNRFIFSMPFWQLQAPVVDSTGLVGRYDIHWVLGGVESHPLEPVSIIETCKRELGLRLDMTKGQVDAIHIVHVEKPSNN